MVGGGPQSLLGGHGDPASVLGNFHVGGPNSNLNPSSVVNLGGNPSSVFNQVSCVCVSVLDVGVY
jgi:hypothetical protein